MIDLLLLIVQQGLVFLLVLVAVFLTARVMKFDDLTVEGSFGIGGAITAWLLVQGMPGLLALLGSGVLGACAGLATGLLATVVRVNRLIAGIVVTTALYSCTLALGGSYTALMATKRLGAGTLFGVVPAGLLILVPLAVLVLGGVAWILRTQIGFVLRATGQNPSMVTGLGKSGSWYLLGTMMAANALTAVAGSLFAQLLGFFSLTSAVGVLVIALSGLLLSECFAGPWWLRMVLGSCAYPVLVAVVISLGLDPVWNKAAIACLMTGLLVHKRLRQGGLS